MEGENREALEAYSDLLAGTKPVERDFRENLIDGVVSFLNQPVWQNFENKIYVAFDQLTSLAWKIKELEAEQMGVPLESVQGVNKVDMLRTEQEFINGNLQWKTGVDIESASRQELLLAAAGMAADLKSLLGELSMVYKSNLAADELTAHLLVPDYPALVLIAVSLWRKIGQYLEDLNGWLEKLTFSLQVFGAPVAVNYEMVERSNIYLHSACSNLRIITAILNRDAAPYQTAHLLEVLDQAAIYPFYHLQYRQGVRQTMHELTSGSAVDLEKYSLQVEEITRSLKNKIMAAFVLRSSNIWEITGERVISTGDGEVIDLGEVDSGRFFGEKILAVIKELLAVNLQEEAETLIRAYQLVDNTVDLKEYHRQKEHYEVWLANESLLKSNIRKARKRRLTLK